MMKHKIRNIILLPTVLVATSVNGAAYAFTGNQPGTSATPTPAGRTSGPAYVIPQSGGNAAESGRSSSNMQYLTAGVSGTASVMYGAKCKSTAWWNCVFSAMAGIGAVQSLQSARGSSAAGMQLSGFDPSNYGNPTAGGGTDQWGNPIGAGPGGGAGDGTGTNGAGGTGLGATTPQTVARDLATVRSILDRNGVKVSPDGRTVTTPDGRSFDISKGAGSTEQDLMNMGFSQAEAAAALADSKIIGKKVNEKFKQMSQLAGVGAGAGGAGRSIAAEAGAGSDPFAGFDPYGRDRMGRNRAKAKISGLTKKLGSDTIGVAGDDIFEMVTRRYKAREQDNAFLKD